MFGISALLSDLAAGGDFHTAWVLMALAALATAAVGGTVGRVRATPAPVPLAIGETP